MPGCRPSPAGPFATPAPSALVSWVDLYRVRLAALLPHLAPLDALGLALEAFEDPARPADPVLMAEAFAAAFRPRLTRVAA